MESNVNEKRLDRLEDKVDSIKADVSDLKADMRVHLAKVDEHIAGDKKIITEWRPVVELVPELKEIIDNHKFEKRAKERRHKFIAVTATVVALVAGVFEIFRGL